MSLVRRALLALAASLCLPAWALDAPSGPVVLSIAGALQQPNRDGRALFDMAMLERLPQHSFTTKTPWYPAAHKFTGPLLRDVLAAAGVPADAAGQARCVALNDYKVDIPLDDLRRYDVVLARLIDDKPIGVREKGPLFVIYPFDERPELRTSVYYGRCIWQLKAIEWV